MFRTTACLLLLLAASLAPAADTKTGTAGKPSPAVRAQAEAYARQMMSVIGYVEQRYVRPVERAALVEAAIIGLYEAVRAPFPAGLRNDLARARSIKEFEYILVSSREQLGDVDALRDQRALLVSLKSLPRALDPYCGVPTNAELRRSMGNENQSGLGIELELTQESQLLNFDLDNAQSVRYSQRGPFRILTVTPGSPAQRAGMRPGDLITHVAGQPTSGDQGPLLLRRLLFFANEGRSGELTITVKRAAKPEGINLSLAMSPYAPEWVYGARRNRDNSWNFMLDPQARIGYVRIGFIDNLAPQQVESALNDLLGAGIKGLLLDLRDCPGGYVDPAVEITSMFIPSGTIATVRDRGSQEQRYQATGRQSQLKDISIVVLVNGDTMGGGEMIASALQDHSVAKVCGQRTFGKGSVQRTQTVSEVGFSFKLTTGLFTRPNGKNLQRFPDSKPEDDWGVRPNAGYELPLTPDLQRQLKQWHIHYLLRPGDCREPLPLDDPENDPVRQFAVRELMKTMK